MPPPAPRSPPSPGTPPSCEKDAKDAMLQSLATLEDYRLSMVPMMAALKNASTDVLRVKSMLLMPEGMQLCEDILAALADVSQFMKKTGGDLIRVKQTMVYQDMTQIQVLISQSTRLTGQRSAEIGKTGFQTNGLAFDILSIPDEQPLVLLTRCVPDIRISPLFLAVGRMD